METPDNKPDKTAEEKLKQLEEFKIKYNIPPVIEHKLPWWMEEEF